MSRETPPIKAGFSCMDATFNPLHRVLNPLVALLTDEIQFYYSLNLVPRTITKTTYRVKSIYSPKKGGYYV